MATMDQLRAGIRKSFPEIEEIENPELRDKVVEAWALALSQTEFTRVEEIRASGERITLTMRRGTQAEHIRGVTRMAVAMAEQLEQVVGPLGIDRDLLIACALCHDVGTPFEFSPSNHLRWCENETHAGVPAIRHPIYGAYITLSVGLPEAVAQAAGTHSTEGECIQRSLENTIVHLADRAFWLTLERAGMLVDRPFTVAFNGSVVAV